MFQLVGYYCTYGHAVRDDEAKRKGCMFQNAITTTFLAIFSRVLGAQGLIHAFSRARDHPPRELTAIPKALTTSCRLMSRKLVFGIDFPKSWTSLLHRTLFSKDAACGFRAFARTSKRGGGTCCGSRCCCCGCSRCCTGWQRRGGFEDWGFVVCGTVFHGLAMTWKYSATVSPKHTQAEI